METMDNTELRLACLQLALQTTTPNTDMESLFDIAGKYYTFAVGATTHTKNPFFTNTIQEMQAHVDRKVHTSNNCKCGKTTDPDGKCDGSHNHDSHLE
jgi:hypothetical protein